MHKDGYGVLTWRAGWFLMAKPLRLYDRNDQRRLTEAEVAMRRAETLAEKLRALGYES